MRKKIVAVANRSLDEILGCDLLTGDLLGTAEVFPDEIVFEEIILNDLGPIEPSLLTKLRHGKFDAIIIPSKDNDPSCSAASKGGYLTGFVMAEAIAQEWPDHPPIFIITDKSCNSFKDQIRSFMERLEGCGIKVIDEKEILHAGNKTKWFLEQI